MKQEVSKNLPSYQPIISQTNPLSDPEMKQDLLKSLPSDIIIDILSRLSVGTIIRCKCVCKSWLYLVETREFVKSHISKSVPGLIVFESKMRLNEFSIFDFEDGLELEHHNFHYNLVNMFNLCFHGWMCGSANGLLFLRDSRSGENGLYICNPITRDYINLPCPQGFAYPHSIAVTYGFGVSKTTDQYKLVQIFCDCVCGKEFGKLLTVIEAGCQVYSLGTGSWRSIASGPSLDYYNGFHGEFERSRAVFVNGNLHWLVYDSEGYPWISCFDLETELFSTLSPPPLPDSCRKSLNLFALGDCLCFCDNTSHSEIVIWLMKEYGIEGSWVKEFVINKNHDFARECYETGYADFPNESYNVHPIKFFKDGDIMMAWSDILVFYYSNKTKTIQKLDIFEQQTPADSIVPILHTPSFLSLRSFEMEKVRSF